VLRFNPLGATLYQSFPLWHPYYHSQLSDMTPFATKLTKMNNRDWYKVML